jgi:hypothetical protein
MVPALVQHFPGMNPKCKNLRSASAVMALEIASTWDAIQELTSYAF